MEQWWRQLRWSASGHGWFAKTDEVSIFVSEQTYEKHLRAYLASQGIKLKTYAQIMRPAEEEWRRQCETVNTFQANLNYWLTCNEGGVQIHPHPIKAER